MGNRRNLFVAFGLPALVFALVVYLVLAPHTPKQKMVRHGESTPLNIVNGSQNYIRIGPEGEMFVVEVASTAASREQGLSGRSGLEQSRGMLFAFDQPNESCFWMKDMTFDIDILWFNQSQNLIYMKQNATPASYPAESFCPPAPAKYVIEVPAGTAQRLHLKVGDSFSQQQRN